MPQQYKPGLSAEEKSILGAALPAYELEGEPEQLQSLDVWEGRFIVSFALGTRRFFFKEWPSFVENQRECAFCLDIQDWVRAQGVPTAHMYATTDGERIFTGSTTTDASPRRFSLYEFVGSGYDPRLGREQILDCARSLGQLHAATARAEIGGRRWRNDPFSPASTQVTGAREELAKLIPAKIDAERVTKMLDELASLLERAEKRMLALDWFGLPAIPVHGDYCHFNCRFDGDRVAAIVDFDHARLGSRLMDMARAVNTGLGWPIAIDYYEDFHWQETLPLDRDALAAWLAAYAEHAPPLTAAERRLLPLACAADWVDATASCFPRSAVEMDGCKAALDYGRDLLDRAEVFSRAF